MEEWRGIGIIGGGACQSPQQAQGRLGERGYIYEIKKNDKVISQGKNLSSLILDVIAGAGAGAGYTSNGDDVFSRRVLSCERHKELKYSR